MKSLVLFLSLSCLGVPAQAADLAAVVVLVYDGDTITVDVPDVPPVFGDDIGVRVAGIDAPEMRGGTPETRRLAIQARDVVRGLCPTGSVVTLRDAARDKYFRVLARIECGGVDVAEELLRRGLAREYGGGKKRGW